MGNKEQNMLYSMAIGYLLNEIKKKNLGNENTDIQIDEEMVNNFQNELSKDFKIEQEKLAILTKYEEENLKILKEYKEEIKFLYSSQEELRKEMANFFASTLKEIITTLKNEEVDSKIASIWLNSFVESYTKSLDLSEKFAQEGIMDLIENLRKKRKEIVNSKIPNVNLQNEKK